MTGELQPAPFERAQLTEQDLAIAALVSRYIERREHHQTPCVHDLLAAAAEFGDIAVDVLRTVLACYEAMRADGDDATSADSHESPHASYP
jgi:hypothetical protein